MCITLSLENGNSHFRKQLFLLYPREDRSTKAHSFQSSGALCYGPSFRIHHEAHAVSAPPRGSMSILKNNGLTAQGSSYTEVMKVKPVCLVRDVSKQESKHEALDDSLLV